MTDFRELLIGCGHSRVKKMPSVDGNPSWRGLVTLDINLSCNPDFWCRIGDQAPWEVSCLKYIPNFNCVEDEAGKYFPAASFDEVHAYEVLEHLGSQGDAVAFFTHFSEIYRILKPGGHLYATVPSRFSPWLWGDPSHRRAILPESLVFLDQAEYARQLDGPQKTAMSDFRYLYQSDFRIIAAEDNRMTFAFVLQAVKPSRYTPPIPSR